MITTKSISTFKALDNNHPVEAHCDEGGGLEEIWSARTMMEEPVIEKCWMNLTTECSEAFYRTSLTGLFERMNPLRYKGKFMLQLIQDVGKKV